MSKLEETNLLIDYMTKLEKSGIKINNTVFLADIAKSSAIIADKLCGEERTPKGHWEHGKELGKEYQGKLLVNISYEDCHLIIKQSDKPKWNFCPNCGADMRESEEK